MMVEIMIKFNDKMITGWEDVSLLHGQQEEFKKFLKSKDRKSFFHLVRWVIYFIVSILLLDLVFSYFFDGWLFYSRLFDEMRNILTGESYVYSDTLNYKLTFYGVLVTFFIVYLGFWLKGPIIKKQKVVRVNAKKRIPLYVSIKGFTYTYCWLVLTTMCVMASFYNLVFDLNNQKTRILIPAIGLVIIAELLLTIYFFDYSKKIKKYLFLLELLEKQKDLPYDFQLIDKLLTKSCIILTKGALSQNKKRQRLLLLCIDYGVIKKFKQTQANDGTISISLSEEAKIFFQNQAAIMNEGLIVGELTTYNETDTSK